MRKTRKNITDTHNQMCTYNYMVAKLDHYSCICSSLDATFGFLRVVNPIEDEMNQYENKAIITQQI